MTALDRMIYKLFAQILATNHEMQMDLGEYLGILFRTFSLQAHFATRNQLPAVPQYQDNIVSGTAPGSEQNHFHRARPEVASAALGRTVHDHRMPAAGLGDKAHAIRSDPFDCAVHISSQK